MKYTLCAMGKLWQLVAPQKLLAQLAYRYTYMDWKNLSLLATSCCALLQLLACRLVRTSTKLAIGLPTCTHFSSNHFVQSSNYLYNPLFSWNNQCFMYFNQSIQLKLKLFYVLQSITNYMIHIYQHYILFIYLQCLKFFLVFFLLYTLVNIVCIVTGNKSLVHRVVQWNCTSMTIFLADLNYRCDITKP